MSEQSTVMLPLPQQMRTMALGRLAPRNLRDAGAGRCVAVPPVHTGVVNLRRTLSVAFGEEHLLARTSQRCVADTKQSSSHCSCSAPMIMGSSARRPATIWLARTTPRRRAERFGAVRRCTGPPGFDGLNHRRLAQTLADAGTTNTAHPRVPRAVPVPQLPQDPRSPYQWTATE
jgi:hypothetical protein